MSPELQRRLLPYTLGLMLGYFDAGTGSMIASFFVAGFAGIAVFGKAMLYKLMFWRKPPEELQVTVEAADLELDVEEID